MNMSTVIRIGAFAAIAAQLPAAVACSRPDAHPGTGAAAPRPSTVTTPAAAAGADPLWHYDGEEGPAHWGALSPKFAPCTSGRAQSPIDIVAPARGATNGAVAVNFPPASLRIIHQEHVADTINNGHTIQVNYSEGDILTVGASAYQLAQYHFHSPSEHTVDGKNFPMEMHLVHAGADGRLAVIAVLIVEGAHNAAFDPVWGNLPTQKGAEHHLAGVKVDVDALLPAARTTYRYDGSLTTPPCSEGVQWFVMTTPITLSAAQIGAFTALFHDNHRPVQPLNGRSVLIDAVGGID